MPQLVSALEVLNPNHIDLRALLSPAIFVLDCASPNGAGSFRSETVRKDPVLHGECLGGALYTEDFKRSCHKVGFGEPRELSATPVVIGNPAFEEKVGLTEFVSITFRCFKLQQASGGALLEDSGPCEEDYGHTATYLGTRTSTRWTTATDPKRVVQCAWEEPLRRFCSTRG